ncbi:MAG: hypothetical protein E7452_11160 [Ruminococcaceae bacterium]|nr:hypothetical protein [Oscillospiraceae bacterium]
MGKSNRIREQRQEKLAAAAASATKKKGMSPKLKSILIGVLCAVIVIGLAAGVIVNTRRQNGTALKNADAVLINGKTYKAEEVDFYYNLMVNQYYNYNLQMSQTYGFSLYDADFTKSLFDQTYNAETGLSWGDFLLEQAVDQLYNYIILEEAGKAAGFEMPAEGTEAVQAMLTELKAAALRNGMTEGQYLKAIYGNAISLEKYTKYATREAYAQCYSDYYAESLTVTDEELEQQYNENKKDYDLANYRTFTVKVELPEHLDANGAAYSDDATKAADEAVVTEALANLKTRLEAVDSEEAFLALAEEMTRGVDADGNETAGIEAEKTLMTNIGYEALSEDIRDWMFDDARKAGDTNVTKGTSTIVAFYYLDRSDRSELTRNVRHILLATTKESEEIKAKAEAILADFNVGPKTAESFGELAIANSEDPGSKDAGGLYENVIPGQMISEFNDWLFDEERKSGDTGIIFSEETGYHIMYYVGESDRTTRQLLTDNDIRNERYEAYVEDLELLYPLVTYEAGLAKID